jgi:hypothetical protein
LGFLITLLSMFIGYTTLMVLFSFGNSGFLFDSKWFVQAMFFPLLPGVDSFLRFFGILYFVAPIIAIVWRKHKNIWIAMILAGFVAGLILLYPLELTSL